MSNIYLYRKNDFAFTYFFLRGTDAPGRSINL